MGEVVMSKHDQKMYELAIQVLCKRLTIVEFSVLVNKSYRQSKRIIKKVQAQGMKGVKHGNLGKVPINKTDPELEMDVLSLLKGKYYDFNLTHFREMIETHEGIRAGKNILNSNHKCNLLSDRVKTS